jgi:hypothetical protein
LFFPQNAALIVALAIASATACSTEREPPQDPGQRFVCADEQPLDIIHTKELAIVKLGERIINLHARKASVGQRYTDGDATLIIDEDTAVFVAGDGREAMTCDLQVQT